MSFIKKFVDAYASFISRKPKLILVLVLILTAIALIGALSVQTVPMDNKDALPDDILVLQTFDKIADQFGGSDSVQIVLELDSKYSNSNEPRDIRSAEIILYSSVLEEFLLGVDDVTGVTGPASLIKDLNGGKISRQNFEIRDITSDSSFEDYISSNYEMMIISARLSDSYDENILYDDLIKIISQIPKPAGITVKPAGSVMEGPAMEEALGPDMQKTSNFSLIGILLVLLIVFRSFRYSLTPLSTIIIGVIWAFGYIGLTGLNLNSATSGVISMIMGIGIDFGIQTVVRYRQELKKNLPQESMRITLSSVIIPMATTTLAAIIGFRAMGLGDLTIMAEMGLMMSYGVIACFFAAITAVPAILLVTQKKPKKKKIRSKKFGELNNLKLNKDVHKNAHI